MNDAVEKCRLCCDPCLECNHSLFGDFGQCTEIYEITVKYFDPMLLVMDNSDDNLNQSKVICKECWKHISAFHAFQQNVILAQCRLVSDVKPILEEFMDIGAIHFEVENDEKEKNDCVIDMQNSSEGAGSGVLDNPEDSTVPKDSTNPKKQNGSVSYSSDDGEDWNLLDESDDSFKTKYLSTIKKDSSKQRKKKINLERKTTTRCKKSKVKDIESSKKASYNSAEKLQELDNFISDVKPELECDLCKLPFPNYNSLRLHFTKEHQTKCYVVCCNKKIVRRYLLVEHLRLHVNPETYKCDICGSNSNSSRTLLVHKRFMHETTKTHECEVCQRKFKNKTILMRHMATHAAVNKEFKCEQCGRLYAFEFQLKIHASKVHNEQKICDQCGKMMNGSAALKQHILLQHSDIKLQKWSCDQCDAKLSSHKSLKSHILSFHNDGTTAFICKDCGKVAASENALMRHKKFVHEMERKFKCTYCDKAFKKNTNLKEHIATHTGQHLYQCPHCTLTFNNNANMHKHRKRAHPVEWAESRLNRIIAPKVKPDSVIKEILL